MGKDLFSIALGIVSIFLFAMLLSFVMPTVNAQTESLGTFKAGSCVPLKQSCSNCTSNNITSINVAGVNPMQLLGQVPMNKSGFEYNYTFCDTSVIGKYIVNGVGDINGANKVWAYDFIITPNGSSNMLGFYIMLTIVLVGILLVGIFTKNIPLTLIGGMLSMAWGVYIGLNGFDSFQNTATQYLSVGITALGAVWIGIAGLEYFDII